MEEARVKTILELSGYKIPPYRLARMSETTAKIVKLVTCDATCGYTYREARFILDAAVEILERGAQD